METINQIKDWVIALQWNSLLAFLLYWTPLAVCAVTYTVRIIEQYKKDLADREADNQSYYPELTIGFIVGHIFLSITPCINLGAAVFDCMGAIFKRLKQILDIPLVPKRKKPKA